jgi:hypothetical protein
VAAESNNFEYRVHQSAHEVMMVYVRVVILVHMPFHGAAMLTSASCVCRRLHSSLFTCLCACEVMCPSTSHLQV